jgi:hypothetical protein
MKHGEAIRETFNDHHRLSVDRPGVLGGEELRPTSSTRWGLDSRISAVPMPRNVPTGPEYGSPAPDRHDERTEFGEDLGVVASPVGPLV